jgi:hypothetical protein
MNPPGSPEAIHRATRQKYPFSSGPIEAIGCASGEITNAVPFTPSCEIGWLFPLASVIEVWGLNWRPLYQVKFALCTTEWTKWETTQQR